MLCFSVDSRESSQNLIELWLPEIRHYCSNKIPILLVGCKIDLRLNGASTNQNRHFILKQEHLNHQANLSGLNLPNQLNKTISSIHYNQFKTLALYCCRHARLCTCYHSRICATNCRNNMQKNKTTTSRQLTNQLSNSSSCLLNNAPTSNASLACKDNIIRCNRMLLQQQSPIRNSTEEEDSFSSSEDAEELQSNTLSNSSCSLNGQDKITFNNTYNNSIYRHNQSMLNTLMHNQQLETRCNNSLNSSESEESEAIDNVQVDMHDALLQDNNYHDDTIDNHLINQTNLNHRLPNDNRSPAADCLQSSLEDTNKQPFLKCRSKLFKGYKNLTNTDDNNNRSLKLNNKINLDLSKKEKKLFKSSSLKQKLSTIFNVNSSQSKINQSERKLSSLFYNRKLNTSSASLPFSLMYNKLSAKEQSPLISTEEGLRLCSKIGAHAYVVSAINKAKSI